MQEWQHIGGLQAANGTHLVFGRHCWKVYGDLAGGGRRALFALRLEANPKV